MLGLSAKIYTTVFTPMIASVAVVCGYLILKYSESSKLDMARHHMNRAMVQLLLLSYAPLTRRAVAMLICRPGVDRGYAFFGGWLNDDMSVL